MPEELGHANHKCNNHAHSEHHEQAAHRLHIVLVVLGGGGNRGTGALVVVQPFIAQSAQDARLAEPEDAPTEVGSKVGICKKDMYVKKLIFLQFLYRRNLKFYQHFVFFKASFMADFSMSG